MRSTFMGLDIGRKAIVAQQYALDVTGHNVANTNTAGYTRQTAVLNATTPYASPQKYAISPGQFGTGVEVSDVTRIRDLFMDLQYRNEAQSLGYWGVQEDIMDKLEGILNEPTDDGLRGVIDLFWKSFENLSENPETDAARSTVVESAQTVVDTVQNMYRQLKELEQDLNSTVKTKVDDINSMAKQIADLNKQIQAIYIGGESPNDLMDSRDYLIDQLSQLVNLKVYDDRNGMSSVVVGGRELVGGIYYNEMSARADDNGIFKVVWGDSQDYEVPLTGGSLKGTLDSRGVNTLFWNTGQTHISKVKNEYSDHILNYQVDTDAEDQNLAVVNAAVSKLYEYSDYSGDLLPSSVVNAATLSRQDLNGQVLLEVISKTPNTNELTLRYTVDMVDRTGVNHFTNTGIFEMPASFAAGGNMTVNMKLNETGSETLNITLPAMTNASSAFVTGDKFVLGFTAQRATGASANDGLTIHSMDTIAGGKDHDLQYYFNEGVMVNRNMNLGTFALNETTGEIYQNDEFIVGFNDVDVLNPFRTGSAVLVNKTGKSLRDVYSQEIVNKYTGDVPDLMNALNTITKVMIETMNKVHRSGYNLNKFPNNTNINFFKDYGDEADEDFAWAEKIEISDEVKSDMNNIAAATSATRDSLGNRINYGDGGNALKMANVKQQIMSVLGDATMDDYWRSVSSDLGVVSQQAARMNSNTQNLIDEIDTKRLSTSGVSLDEEMTNMITFQHAYNAAARYVTAVDEALDVIINRMGTVGT